MTTDAARLATPQPTEALLAATCLPLPEAVIGLMVPTGADAPPQGWGSFDRALITATVLIGGALSLAMLATAAAS